MVLDPLLGEKDHEVLAQLSRSTREPPAHNRVQENVEAKMRQFGTGATRHTDEGKLDYEGFLNPEVLREFARYMHKNRVQADGELRASDNWQKGIPEEAYMKSLTRHFMDVWLLSRGGSTEDCDIRSALCGVMFNAMGYLYEVLVRNGDAVRCTTLRG